MSFLIEVGILSGKDAGRAAPDDTITNAEIIALTMRMLLQNLQKDLQLMQMHLGI